MLDLEILTSPSSGAAGYARRLGRKPADSCSSMKAEGWRPARATRPQLQSPYERAVYEGPVNRRPLQLTLALAVREAKQRPRWWDSLPRPPRP